MARRQELDVQLAELETLDLAQLRHTWRRRLRTAPPKVSAGLLRLALAHAVQEKALGGLAPTTRRRLRKTASTGRPRRSMLPGMQLVRVWQGVSYVVTMGEDGIIRWNDQEWRSLSAVARAITGARWSGPAFFGLRSKRGEVS